MCKRAVCLQYRAKREFGKSPFLEGNKYCKLCGNADEIGIYIKWEGVFCPCCGYKLRTRGRHRKKFTSRYCIECRTTISMRGEFSLWFNDNEDNDVCWQCWFKIHKAICIDCGKEGKVAIGIRNFIITSVDEIRCKICHSLNNYKKSKQRYKKKIEKPILPRFH